MYFFTNVWKESSFWMRMSSIWPFRPTGPIPRNGKDEDKAPPVPGSTLAGDGPYNQTIDSLYDRSPYLRYRDFELLDPTAPKKSRAVSFRAIPAITIRQNKFSNPEDLCEYLKQPQDVHPHRELFILEGLQPHYVDVLGRMLQVDPNIFMRHDKTGLWQSGQNSANFQKLPSLLDSSRSFVLEYYDLVHFSKDFKHHVTRTAENERFVNATTIDNEWDRVGIVQRRISFWANSQSHDGWKALLIVDAPFKEALIGNRHNFRREPVANVPYQGGFPDFILGSNGGKGPPRTGLYDDLCYYFETHSQNLSFDQQPASAVIFATKIVALQYAMLLDYHRGHFDHLERSFLDLRSLQGSSVHAWQEQRWDALNFLHRRFKFQQDNIQSTLLELRSGQRHHPTLYGDAIADFEYLELQCDRLQKRIDTLVASASTVASILSANRSRSENRNVFKLTLLATIFLPLSFVSALFSMQQEYEPGGAKSWIYWVVSATVLTIVILLIFYQLRHNWIRSRTSETAAWNFRL